jgi:hypothetical protein
VCAGVVGEKADDVQLVEILERVVFEISKFTAENEVKQLLLRGTIWHGCLSYGCPASVITQMNLS